MAAGLDEDWLAGPGARRDERLCSSQDHIPSCIAAAFIETQIETTQKAWHPQTVITRGDPGSDLIFSIPPTLHWTVPSCTGQGEIWSNHGVFEMY